MTNISCEVSLGVSCFLNEDTDVLELVERADKALYEAKTTGRDRSVLRDRN